MPYYLDYAGSEWCRIKTHGRSKHLYDARKTYSDGYDPNHQLPGNHSIEGYVDHCIYCNTLLTKDDDFSISKTRYNDETAATLGSTYNLNEQIQFCPSCQWWKYTGKTNKYIWPGEGSEGRDQLEERLCVVGKIKTFDLTIEQQPLHEMRLWLSRHPHDLAHTNPHAFEKLMAVCVKDLYPEAEVMHIGNKSGDGGIDIKLILSNKENMLVQVKRREKLDSKEGVQCVRELNGVLLREGVAKGMVITTARDFTRNAKAETNIAGNLTGTSPFDRYQVQLLAFNDVVNMLNLQKPSITAPWKQHQRVFETLDYRELILHPGYLTDHDPRL